MTWLFLLLWNGDPHVHLLQMLIQMVLAAKAIAASSTAPGMGTVRVGGTVNRFDVPVKICRTGELCTLGSGKAAGDEARVGLFCPKLKRVVSTIWLGRESGSWKKLD